MVEEEAERRDPLPHAPLAVRGLVAELAGRTVADACPILSGGSAKPENGPVLLTEPAAKQDDRIVHALCLTQKRPASRTSSRERPGTSSAA